jgi:anti-sigma factor RsiW
MTCEEYLDLAAADVDGELDPGERAAVETHVRSCARCQAVRTGQRSTRDVIRGRATRHSAPAGVEHKVLAAIERRPAERRAGGRRRSVAGRRAVVAGAVAAALALGVATLLRPAQPDLVAVMVDDVHAAEHGAMSLAVRTGDAAELRRYYRERAGIRFPHAVADLGAAGLHLVGGRPGMIGAARTTVALYEGAAGMVVCRRFRAGEVELPSGGERMDHSRVYTADGIIIRVKQLDDDVVCAMASTMPRAEFLRFFVADRP